MNTAEQEAKIAEPAADVAETPSVAAESTVGEQLIAAREAQSLSVTDIANRLKLSVNQVVALEQGEYGKLPGAVFVRGFTRNYARLVKLDPESILRQVEEKLPRAAPERPPSRSGEANIPMPAKSGRHWPVLAAVAAVVFLGAALIDVLWPETPAPPQVSSAPVTPVAPTPTAPPAVEAPQARLEAPAATDTLTNAPAPSEAAAAAGGAVRATYQSGTTATGHVLRFVFDQSSWVQVKDAAGKIVIEALYAAGTTHEIDAAPPLSVVIGNAPGVHLTYGDRAVDLAPHTHVAVARLTLQ